MFRAATSDDADAIARIYNEGIEDRLATFETRLRSTDEIAERIRSTDHPLVVAVDDGRVLAWAGTGMYRDRQCYAGVAEFSFYVAREARGRGVGTAILRELVRVAEERGFWKLVSRIFPENAASLRAWDGPITDAIAHLERCSVPVELGPVPRKGGPGQGTSVYFRDPDGSLLELISSSR